MLADSETNAPASQSRLTLQDVIAFIRQAPPEEFLKLRAMVRAVEVRHLFKMRQCFKRGDEVEWEIRKNAGLSECFKGKVVAVNRSCCVVAVTTSEEPPTFQYYRVRFELLHYVESGQACFSAGVRQAELGDVSTTALLVVREADGWKSANDPNGSGSNTTTRSGQDVGPSGKHLAVLAVPGCGAAVGQD